MARPLLSGGMLRHPLSCLALVFGFVACGASERPAPGPSPIEADRLPAAPSDDSERDASTEVVRVDGADASDANVSVPPDASGTCASLCSRASQCLTELVGSGGSPQACLDWCGTKIPAQNSATCATCFETQQCSAIFRDPHAPWDITHLNPGDCIEECGLGTCGNDAECDPTQVCTANAGKVECIEM